jgi:hypothetical protein
MVISVTIQLTRYIIHLSQFYDTCILIRIVFVHTPHFRDKRHLSLVISARTDMSAKAGRISVKYDIMDFLRKSMDKILNLANIGHFTWRRVYALSLPPT